MSVEETPLTAAEIYDKLTKGPGLDSLRGSQDTLSQLRRLMEDSAADVRALNGKIAEGFQGTSGNAAANGTKPLSMATDDDLDHLAKLDDSVSAQMTAFGTAQNSVQPVSAQPPEFTAADIVDALGGKGDSYGQKVGQWAAAGQANIQAFSAYYDASMANGQTAPSQFGQVVDPGEQITMASTAPPSAPGTSSPTTGKPGTGGATGPGSRGDLSVSPRTTAVPSSPVSQPGLNAPSSPTSPTWNDGTSAAAYTPSAGNLPEGYQFGPTGSLDPRSNPNVTGNYGPNSGAPGYGGYYAGTGALDPGGSGSRGAYGSGGYGANEPGAGEAGGRGAGQAGGRGALGAGRGSGSGSGSVEENAAAKGGRAGTSGGTGKPGQSGMPGMGHGGKKEEDKEHKRPGYLRNPDPEGTFAGPIPKTAPPVIGER